MQHLLFKSLIVATVSILGLVIDEKTSVPIAGAVAMASAWGYGLWWLGRKLKGLEDGLKVALEDRETAKQVMAGLIVRLDQLPCRLEDSEKVKPRHHPYHPDTPHP